MTRLPDTLKCPACGTVLNGSISATGSCRGPSDGDLSICAHCRALLVYAGTPVNSLRYPTDEEQQQFLADPEVQQVIAATGEFHRRHGGIPFRST